MKYEQYISLIKRLETEAKENPKSYKFRVTSLALLGYAYFIGIAFFPLLIILVAALFLWFVPGVFLILLKFLGKLIWVLLLFIGGIFSALFGAFKSFFAEIEKPYGHQLERVEATELFDVVDEIRENIKAPMPDHILVNNDFNASVMTFPRFGFFGKVTYLNLGLPLMEAVSPEQFRAILAHEMGHISKKHGSDAAWIYQLREAWGRFLEAQETSESVGTSFLYHRFVNWYFPYFNAYSFVLAREQEREADQMAVELYGAEPLAEALINTQVKGNYLETDYWKSVFDGAKTNSQPPENVFSKMFNSFRSETDEGKDILALSKALSVRTDFSDTHPALSERLELMKYQSFRDGDNLKLPKSHQNSAADHYLGELSKSLTKQFDNEWKNDVRPMWKAHYEYLGEVSKRIKELDLKATKETLSEEEMYELAELKATIEDNQSAIPILEEIIKKHPEQASAKYSLGVILLENEDDRGVELLKEAMVLDRSFTIAVCEQLYAYLHSKNRDDEALPYLRKADSFYDVILEAEKERANITDQDEYEPHDIEAEQLELIKQQISYHEEVAEAYLVKKKVQFLPEEPCYILGIKTKKTMLGRSVGVSDDDLLNVLVEQAGKLKIHYVLIFSRQFRSTESKMQNTSNSRIYKS